jgi:hypothetical protein
MGRKEKVYGVYKGDRFITVGTIKEIAAEMGIKTASVRYKTTSAYRKRYPGTNHMEVFPLDD